MHIEPREVPGTHGGLAPTFVGVPVYHRNSRIGTAEINSLGEIKIQFETEFDKTGIFNLFWTGFAQGITFGIESPPAVEIRKIINRED